ncbi:hypothetical protein CcaverHIS002_0704540 [Cutaneotrichosporon cavernicola]|uniref:Uncharacterized protein n=1 Tax=Cutaneotrichosporon cavernicola TaxID=279322 RepID=A0AA48L9X0_9TREE|nr:uncharacterized protein CcaverHIS019_0704620 [Cutaneotrichosporon cavernicola]BEI87108.1 hypothetical protein CcaverHIS002_0704540 [Cutaneotrichosporon cavernicola]BEI94881.1 hypothetical protein CcaverHIS019_0704620 [Cutaneotrichosporon cavernicola]BEJ02655.1 hypothetical protein CcaverHIS631_0704500 [Cutaneotrichosporon cavernicola]BEJ10411.1 hypothetical protein CcaverHIS641_0704460 [Cutaneotrichosporon cavernicola]
MPSSLLWKIQTVLVDLAHTPMLPPAPVPPCVELTPVSPSFFSQRSPSSPPSATSSFEIDAEAAPAVRDMIAAATRDTLA